MPQSRADKRCRVVLITPDHPDDEEIIEMVSSSIADAQGVGDVASLVIAPHGRDTMVFQTLATRLVELSAAKGVASMIVNDTQVFGRSGADGFHVDDGMENLRSAIDRFSPQHMVGAGGVSTRHVSLQIGEMNPDYVFFGKIGADNKDEPHPKNLALGAWWSPLIEIPCIVQAGSTIESVVSVAETGSEFVALSSAVFSGEVEPGDAVMRANVLLDEKAPDLDVEDA